MKTSFILWFAARILQPILLVFSLVLLYRGHNLPGGGFIGGLVAACALLLPLLAQLPGSTPAPLRRYTFLCGVGLLLALLSGLPQLLAGEAYMQGWWLPTFALPLLGTVHLGTPLVFDVGVYLAVIGFIMLSVRSFFLLSFELS